jgi:hypothetical protein
VRNYYLFFLSFLIVLFAPTLYASDKHLVFAIDIIRHGDRTPEIVIPNSSYLWKEGLGELTALGMRQVFNLGADSRENYVEGDHLLSPSYQAGSIYIRSTDYNRTLMSAQSFLYGLYPLGTGPALSETPALAEAFQPIPIHTVPQQNDCLLIPACHVEEFFSLLEQYVFSSEEWKNKTAEYKDKLKKWSQKTGLPLERLDQIVKLGDNLYIREAHGIPLPGGIDEEESKEIQRLTQWVASNVFKPSAVGRYGSRELLSSIAQYLENSTQAQTKLKYVLFSAHDITLMSLMSAFQNPLSTIPPYASEIRLLLFRRQQPDSYILMITFNGAKVKIPFCKEENCTLKEFMRFVENGKLRSSEINPVKPYTTTE